MSMFLHILQVVSAVLLIALVLMHSPKGEGLGSIGGSAQMFKVSSNVEAGLNIVTGICAVLFVLASGLLGWGIVR